jgi:hypothetical protein
MVSPHAVRARAKPLGDQFAPRGGLLMVFAEGNHASGDGHRPGVAVTGGTTPVGGRRHPRKRWQLGGRAPHGAKPG